MEEDRLLAEKAMAEAQQNHEPGGAGDRHEEAAAVMLEAETRRERRRSTMRRRSTASIAKVHGQPMVDLHGEALMQVGGTLPYQRRAELSRIFRQLDGEETWTKGQWDLAREEALARSLPNANGTPKGGAGKFKGKRKGKKKGKGKGGKGKAAANAIRSADAVAAEMNELMTQEVRTGLKLRLEIGPLLGLELR